MTKRTETTGAMLTEAATYDELYRNFRWDIPDALQHGDRAAATAMPTAPAGWR